MSYVPAAQVDLHQLVTETQFLWEINMWFECQPKDEILTPDFVEKLLELKVQADLLEKTRYMKHEQKHWREKVDLWIQGWITQWIMTERVRA
jgi:hypothetical protein